MSIGKIVLHSPNHNHELDSSWPNTSNWSLSMYLVDACLVVQRKKTDEKSQIQESNAFFVSSPSFPIANFIWITFRLRCSFFGPVYGDARLFLAFFNCSLSFAASCWKKKTLRQSHNVCEYGSCSYSGRLNGAAPFGGNVAICSLPVLVFFFISHSLNECVFVQCSFNLQFILIVFVLYVCVCAPCDSNSLFAFAFQKKKKMKIKRICGKCSCCSPLFLIAKFPFNVVRSHGCD